MIAFVTSMKKGVYFQVFFFLSICVRMSFAATVSSANHSCVYFLDNFRVCAYAYAYASVIISDQSMSLFSSFVTSIDRIIYLSKWNNQKKKEGERIDELIHSFIHSFRIFFPFHCLILFSSNKANRNNLIYFNSIYTHTVLTFSGIHSNDMYLYCYYYFICINPNDKNRIEPNRKENKREKHKCLSSSGMIKCITMV